MIYDWIVKQVLNGKKVFALLLDPDEYNDQSLRHTLIEAGTSETDLILVGGSLVTNPIAPFVQKIKENTEIPVLLFPGNLLQISNNADGILFLSLISGRNPDLLIGNHVASAPMIKSSGMEVISTGYILVENGKSTSVEYISNTNPVPADKPDIASATAIAGEMLGLKLIYLEAGSGAQHPVKTEMITRVKKNIKVPLVVGGGIRNPEDAKN
ncbi:MAG TPA: geranylgeranylglyceryl/heptaprenylglyceryl phosphate synthase, partial [Candidatus Cloacimonetes bacterium]|nr:geranylgeranylglyceryl/heptaprenylglyceryl phosphate synthase [Candidatus Cloacimonadota bacterium]